MLTVATRALKTMSTKFDAPDQVERERSNALLDLVRSEIIANQGALSFERYMEICYTQMN